MDNRWAQIMFRIPLLAAQVVSGLWQEHRGHSESHRGSVNVKKDDIHSENGHYPFHSVNVIDIARQQHTNMHYTPTGMLPCS